MKQKLFSCFNDSICFFWHLLEFECFCVRFLGVGLVWRLCSPRPLGGCLSTLILPSSFSVSPSLMPHWLILFLTCLGRNVPNFSNALSCSSKLTMKSAIILQYKYFIPHLDADLRCHIQNTNVLSLPWKITEALCEYDLWALDKYGAMWLGLIENHCHCTKTK